MTLLFQSFKSFFYCNQGKSWIRDHTQEDLLCLKSGSLGLFFLQHLIWIRTFLCVSQTEVVWRKAACLMYWNEPVEKNIAWNWLTFLSVFLVKTLGDGLVPRISEWLVYPRWFWCKGAPAMGRIHHAVPPHGRVLHHSCRVERYSDSCHPPAQTAAAAAEFCPGQPRCGRPGHHANRKCAICGDQCRGLLHHGKGRLCIGGILCCIIW